MLLIQAFIEVFSVIAVVVSVLIVDRIGRRRTLLIYFLTVMGSLGGLGTFALFLGLAVLSWVFIRLMAPETKGRPLEAIRTYWENGGRWPSEEGTLAQLDRVHREEHREAA